MPYVQWWPSHGLCYQKKQQTHGTNKWARKQDFPEFQVTEMKKQMPIKHFGSCHPYRSRWELLSPSGSKMIWINNSRKLSSWLEIIQLILLN